MWKQNSFTLPDGIQVFMAKSNRAERCCSVSLRGGFIFCRTRVFRRWIARRLVHFETASDSSARIRLAEMNELEASRAIWMSSSLLSFRRRPPGFFSSVGITILQKYVNAASRSTLLLHSGPIAHTINSLRFITIFIPHGNTWYTWRCPRFFHLYWGFHWYDVKFSTSHFLSKLKEIITNFRKMSKGSFWKILSELKSIVNVAAEELSSALKRRILGLGLRFRRALYPSLWNCLSYSS